MDLPDFETVFGTAAHRLRGVSSWDHVALLGKENLGRLLDLSRESVLRLVAEGGSRDAARDVKRAIDFLAGTADGSARKPLLPRLRIRSFREGQAVYLYMGDSGGAIKPASWVPATITRVEKSHRADWNDGSANAGYFWRWTAVATLPLFPGQDFVRFSTSEPRVLPAPDLDYIQGAADNDPVFRVMFCENAWRTWEPLWCLERGASGSGGAMDMGSWLAESAPAT